jgi:hypothetical protein
MLIQNCSKGQRVLYKENGKVATVQSVSHNKGEIFVVFENGERMKVAPAMIEPATEEQAVESKTGGSMRPCPRCATKMPVDETTCPSCGFQYGIKKEGGGGFAKALVILIILAAIAYAVWKFVLKH